MGGLPALSVSGECVFSVTQTSYIPTRPREARTDGAPRSFLG
jgi:hypothetical protein